MKRCTSIIGVAACLATLTGVCRNAGAAGQPTKMPADPIATIAEDLAGQLKNKPASCVVVDELHSMDGGRVQRTAFGVYIVQPIATELHKRGVRTVNMTDEARASVSEWIKFVNLSKADAVLQGEYLPGTRQFELASVRICRPMGETLAASRGELLTKDTYLDMDRRTLPDEKTGGAEPETRLIEFKSDIYHSAGTDRAITVEIRPAAKSIHIGESVSFTVKSNVNGYVTLLFFGSSNKLAFLTPSVIVATATIRADQDLRIPADFNPANADIALNIVETGPPGWDRIKVLVSRDPIPWPLANGNVASTTEAHLKGITNVLKEACFGEARCELEVLPPATGGR